MLCATAIFAILIGALLSAVLVSAQTPTPTPTPFGGTPITATATSTTQATTTPVPTTPPPTTGTLAPIVTNTPVPTPTPTPDFNFDEVKEVVVPLIGDDARTHYVTLTEDTAGVVRIRLSLFNFALPAALTMIVYDTGDCSATANPVFEDVLYQAQVGPAPGAESSLVLHFFNTVAISITGGAKSIYDSDGTALALYRHGDAGPSLRAACAVLAPPIGAPSVGTGHRDPTGPPFVAALGVLGLASGLSLLAATAILQSHRSRH